MGKAQVGVGDKLAEGHVGPANGGSGDDGDKGVDLSGGLHAAHGLSDEFGKHIEKCEKAREEGVLCL